MSNLRRYLKLISKEINKKVLIYVELINKNKLIMSIMQLKPYEWNDLLLEQSQLGYKLSRATSHKNYFWAHEFILAVWNTVATCIYFIDKHVLSILKAS